MFSYSERLYDDVYSWKDYPAEAGYLDEVIREAAPDAQTVLDVACGTGRHIAELVRLGYRCEGLDVDEEMLRVAGRRNPGVPLHRGSMLDFALGREFDVVSCLFSSIGYVKSVAAMRESVRTLARHVAPGGVLIVEPWFEPQEWRVGQFSANIVDEPELCIARMTIAEREGDVAITEMHYLVGSPEGIESFTERHELGLFTVEQQLEAFAAAGLDARHDPEGPMGRGLYVGRKPA